MTGIFVVQINVRRIRREQQSHRCHHASDRLGPLNFSNSGARKYVPSFKSTEMRIETEKIAEYILTLLQSGWNFSRAKESTCVRRPIETHASKFARRWTVVMIYGHPQKWLLPCIMIMDGPSAHPLVVP
jgi:hypothetical protein